MNFVLFGTNYIHHKTRLQRSSIVSKTLFNVGSSVQFATQPLLRAAQVCDTWVLLKIGSPFFLLNNQTLTFKALKPFRDRIQQSLWIHNVITVL